MSRRPARLVAAGRASTQPMPASNQAADTARRVGAGGAGRVGPGVTEQELGPLRAAAVEAGKMVLRSSGTPIVL